MEGQVSMGFHMFLLQMVIVEEQVIVSHSPMRKLVPEFKDKLIIVAGMHEVKTVALKYGFKRVITPGELLVHLPHIAPHCFDEPTHPADASGIPSEERSKLNEIAAVMVFHDPRDWYRDIQILLDVLVGYVNNPQEGHPKPRIQPKVYCSNNDFQFSGIHPFPRLAQGAFRICLAALYKEITGNDLKYTMYGKPFPETYRYAEQQLNLRAKRYGYGNNSFDVFYGIGDNPESDIKGANHAGPKWRSVFVKSGTIVKLAESSEQGDIVKKATQDAHYTFDHVFDSVKFILQHEKII